MRLLSNLVNVLLDHSVTHRHFLLMIASWTTMRPLLLCLFSSEFVFYQVTLVAVMSLTISLMDHDAVFN